MKFKKLLPIIIVVLIVAVGAVCTVLAILKKKNSAVSEEKELSVSREIIDSFNASAAESSQLTAKIDKVLALDSSEKRIELIKELSLSEGLEIAPYLGEDVKEYYRCIFEMYSVRSIKKMLNESDNEKIDSFFDRFIFEGNAGNFLPHQYDGCPGLLTKLFGLQPEDQHLLTLEEVIDLMKEVRDESESYTEGDATFYFDDAALAKKISEKYNIKPDMIGGSGMGVITYFLDNEYSELLLISGTVAVLKYDYESGTVRVHDWWDNGIGITPETAFPYADTSECTVLTLD